MTLFRTTGAGVVARKTASALCVAGLLATLAACAAGGTTETMATPTAASTATTPPAPAAATTAAAPKAAPHPLSPTEINEQCWMSSEVNKMKDLDAKAKLVDKCVAEKMRAQGM
jgi:hypothetical protein